MNVLVVGGGKLGANLAVLLRAAGHSPTVIEQRPDRIALLAEECSGITIVEGDGCEPVVLEEAHIARADVVAAVTGDDEDNLVVCLLARRHYNVPRTAARINEPRNEWLFTERFGVDETVSSTRMMADLLTSEVEEQ